MLLNRTAFFLALLSSTLFAAEGGIEVWYFQQPMKIPAVSQEDHPGNTGGDAEVSNRRDTWRIDGMSLDASSLQVGSIDVTLTADLRLKKRVVLDLGIKKIDQTVVLADMKGIGARIRLRHPVSFAMPETIELKCIQQGSQARLELTEAGKAALRDHFSKQLSDFLSEQSFDANFDHSFFNLSGPAELAFNLFLNSKKGELLGELRNHLAAEMAKPGYFDPFLKDIARSFPIPVSHHDQTIELVMDRRNALAPNIWVVREKGATPRFRPEVLREVPRASAPRPSATVLIHAVRLNHLVAETFAHARDNADLSKLSLSAEGDYLFFAPGSAEREEIAKWIAAVDAPTDSASTRVLAIEIAGAHAPVLQPWYVPGQNGAPQQPFLDLWISARWIDTANSSAAQPRLGLLMVFSLASGKLKLVQLSPYKPGGGVGPAVPLADDHSFGRHLGLKLEALLVQSLLNARLESFNPRLQGLSGIRMLGDRGQRAPGERLAEAMAIDLTVR